MSEPTTAAGRALLEDFRFRDIVPGLLYGQTGEPIIAAIEAEAVAAYRAALAATPTPPEIDVERLQRAMASVGMLRTARYYAERIAAAYRAEP